MFEDPLCYNYFLLSHVLNETQLSLNIYSKKQQWKLLLAGAAVIIIIASLWYTNVVVQKIATEERKKVQLWAEAIQKKANLVSYTGDLFRKLSNEERNKIELWAEANKRLHNSENPTDLTFYISIIARNTTIPVLVVDEKGNITTDRNFDFTEGIDTVQFLKDELVKMQQSQNKPIDLSYRVGRHTVAQKLYYKDSKIFSELKLFLDDLIKSFISEIVINSASVPVIYTDSSQTKIIEHGNLKGGDSNVGQDFLLANIEEMRLENEPIAITINNQTTNYIFYSDSELLQQLKYYPYFQILIIALFLLISYYLFSTSRKVEQNQVWVGMAKETAHQLGTPLSSLMAWVEYLKLKDVDGNTINELSKDITRLETITERFSKIGSIPDLEIENLNKVVNDSLSYLKVRISKKVKVSCTSANNEEIQAKLNPSLFSWVLENIIKNAVDAMKGEGSINILITGMALIILSRNL